MIYANKVTTKSINPIRKSEHLTEVKIVNII